MYQCDQLQWNLQQFGRQNFIPVELKEDLEIGQLVIVDTGSADGVRYRRGYVMRILARYIVIKQNFGNLFFKV